MDIFIVYNEEDCRIPRGLQSLLRNAGFSAYIGQCDSCDDENKRRALEHSASLLYLVSLSSGPFCEIPWPLRFMEERKKRTCVVPVLLESVSLYGVETLWDYPYLDYTEGEFYIHRNSSSWISLSEWLKGRDPALFNNTGKL